MFKIFSSKPDQVKGERQVDTMIGHSSSVNNVRFSGTLLVNGTVNGTLGCHGSSDKATVIVGKSGKIQAKGDVKVGYVFIDGHVEIDGTLTCKKLVIKKGASLKAFSVNYTELVAELGSSLHSKMSHDVVKAKRTEVKEPVGMSVEV